MFYHKIPFCSISDKVFENTFEVTTGTLFRNSVNPNRETKRILSNSNMLLQYGSFLVSHYIVTFQKLQKSWKVLEAFLKNWNSLQESTLFKLQFIMLSSYGRLETREVVYWNPLTSGVHKQIVTYIKKAADKSCRFSYTWPLSGYQTLKG